MVDPKSRGRQAKRTYQGILPPLFDKVDVTYPTSTSELYTYSLHNHHNDTYTVTAIISVVYTDATKDCISSITKTFEADC